VVECWTAAEPNRGVFGLNLLSWWQREGGMDRITEPLFSDLENKRLQPVVARSFPFKQAGDAHRYLAERRNIGKVVLTPAQWVRLAEQLNLSLLRHSAQGRGYEHWPPFEPHSWLCE
jgi:hypothetical protein